MVQTTLDNLPEGGKGIIRYILKKDKTTERLEVLGFSKSSAVIKLFSSPFGDPSAYLIGSTVVAIRREDALAVIVEIVC